MGFFGKKAASRTAAPGATDVFTALERECIEALWRLTSLPRSEFEATYGVMLGGFWRYAASARGEAWAALRRETLVCAVAALRARQARVLPRFAAAEDAARVAEVMSFALAACVVAERFAAVAGRATAPGWRPLTDDVPESAAVGRLSHRRDRSAPCCSPGSPARPGSAGSARSPPRSAPSRPTSATARASFAAIAEEAERRIGLPLDRGPAVSAPSASPAAKEATADPPDAPQLQPATAEPAVTPPGGTLPPAIGGEGAGWEWINWVRTGLRDGSVPFNAAGVVATQH